MLVKLSIKITMFASFQSHFPCIILHIIYCKDKNISICFDFGILNFISSLFSK